MSTAFELLLEANERVKNRYTERRVQWVGSPFEWLIRLPSRTVGAAGEALVEEWLGSQGFEFTPSGTTDFDRWCKLQGGKRQLRMEIKFSTLWESGNYVFQQIRDQKYDILLCLGISPNSAHAWAIPKMVAWANATPQHSGERGRDTKWLHVFPESFPQWLAPYGGTLETALQYLRTILGTQSVEEVE